MAAVAVTASPPTYKPIIPLLVSTLHHLCATNARTVSLSPTTHVPLHQAITFRVPSITPCNSLRLTFDTLGKLTAAIKRGQPFEHQLHTE